MPEIGQTISHYRILEKIGVGGMGEVYLAEDLSLDRKVALKFLPEVFTGDPERMARFEREAKLLASLNHPNIAAIYGLEQADGKRFLVLEYVEGETLQARLSKGALPVEDALGVCRQIAEGLEAAHEKGVIHRDLKPANVMITAEEKVKILDFGLAKALADEIQSVESSHSPTITEAMTQPGVVLGTAAYMSPEQAKGKSIDKRTDIWAFGCVLYEMLTGRSMFAAEDVSQTLARVLERQPDFSALPPNLHPKIIEMLERCLEKEVKNRYGSISDARVDIQKVLADPSGALVQPVTAVEPRMSLRMMLPWAVATVILTAIVAGVTVWKLKPTPPAGLHEVIRFYNELPNRLQFGDLIEPALAVSHDGRQIVYSTSEGLYVRSIDEPDAKLIPGTAGSKKPSLSPDGKWIVYSSLADNRLRKIAISGGAPVNLTDASSFGLIRWMEDKKILYGEFGRGVMWISADGGTPEAVLREENDAISDPQILPDGESIIFTNSSSRPAKVMVQSLKSSKRKELLEGKTAQYLPTGHIVYAEGNNLFAVPFDLEELKVAGGPVPVVEGIYSEGSPQYAVSDSGTLVYIPRTNGTSAVQRSLVWVDRKGKEEPISAPTNAYSNLKLSPDGTRVALTFETSGNQDIWIWHLVHKIMMRLTSDEAPDRIPLWSPDGERIVFASHREGNYGVQWKAADGTGEVENLGSVPARLIIPNCWSHDGKMLFLTEWDNIPPRFDISVLSMEGDHARTILLQGKHSEAQPRISPNGRWLAYVSDESGRNEVYVRPFPEVDKGRWQISTNNGDSPLWSPDGHELFYRSGDAAMAVPVETEPTFRFAAPKILFSGAYASYAARVYGQIENNPWDISPDGKRFLMMKPVAAKGAESTAEGPRRINIVLNWLEELKQRVPVP